MSPKSPLRVLLVATGTAATLYLVLRAIGVGDVVLQRDAIVLGFAGVVVALVVEGVIKWNTGRKAQRSKLP